MSSSAKPDRGARTILLIGTAVAGLLALLGGFLSSRLDVHSKKFHEKMSKSALHDELKRESRLSGIKPTARLSSFSRLVYDEKVTDGNFPDLSAHSQSNPTGIKTVILRFSGKVPYEISLAAHAEAGTRLSFRDEFKRVLYTCSAEECEKVDFIHPEGSNLLAIQIEQETDAKPALFQLSTKNFQALLASKEDIPTLDFKLSSVEVLQLRTLAQGALALSTRGSYETPDQRMHGEIATSEDGETSTVKIGLSGHTAGHFTYPPSMAISIDKGPSILGSLKFKLYRLSERSGVVDMLARTHLQGTGPLLPDVHLVRLAINGQSHGIYLFEETYSRSFFESLEVNDGRVLGYNLKMFFKDYPNQIRLQTNEQFATSKSKSPESIRGMELASEKFASRIDPQSFSRLLAFSSLTRGTHGLGADDLRFYEQKVDGNYYPIVRDLNLGTKRPFDEQQMQFEMGTHFGFWYLNRLPSVVPLLQLSATTKTNPLKHAQGLLFWDLHPSVGAFLKDPARRQVFEAMLLRMTRDGIEETFTRRLKNMGSELEEEPDVNTSAFEPVLASIQKHRPYFFTKPLQDFIQTAAPLVQESQDGTLTVHNRLPLRLGINLPSGVMADCLENGKPVLAPAFGNLTARSQRTLSVDYELFPHDHQQNNYTPWCRLRSSSGTKLSRSDLSFTLADGEHLTVATDNGSAPAETRRSGPRRALVQLIDYTQHLGETTLRYAAHFNDAVTLPSNLEGIVFREGGGQEIPLLEKRILRMETITRERTSELDKLPNIWTHTIADPSSLFSKHSQVWVFKFKQTSPLYFRLDKGSVHRVIHEKAPFVKVSILDALENYLPSQTEPLKNTVAALPPYVEAKATGHYRIVAGAPRVLNHILKVEKGTVLEIEPGVEFRLGSEAGFIVEGQLLVNGTSKHPVKFFPHGPFWGGIAFNHAQGKSRISHAELRGLKGIPADGISPAGGISLVHSEVEISDSKLFNLQASDGINVYHSYLNLIRSEIRGASDDALDADFSSGRIVDSHFSDTAGDNVDILHSFFVVSGNRFEKSKDRGLGIGEKSVALVSHNQFVDSEIGAAVKDGSFALFKENTFEKNRAAISRVTKKPWYNLSSYVEKENRFSGNETIFSETVALKR